MIFSLNDGLSQEQIDLKERIYKEMTDRSGILREIEKGAGYIPVSGNIENFVDSIKELIDLDQKEENRKIKLIDEYSYQNILEDPDQPGVDLAGVVVYSLASRTPGTTAGGNSPSSRERREVIPQFRAACYSEKDTPGEVIIQKGKWFDNMLCFKLVARTNHQANKMALWLEDLMELNREFFASRGFVRYYFDRRGEDEYIKDGEIGLHVRPLFFYVRTERVYNISEQIINRLVIGLSN